MNASVINVRQIAQYPQVEPALTDLMLLQTGGLGGPYVSAQVSDLLSTAFTSGMILSVAGLILPPTGVIGWGTDAASQVLYGNALGGALAFTPVTGWRFDYANPDRAITLARLGPDGNLTLEFGTLSVARPPALPGEVVTLGYLQCCAVTSFNGRTGAVCLGPADVYGALGDPGTIATQEWVTATFFTMFDQFYVNKPFVYSFNGRTGPIVLTAADVTAACTAPGAVAQSNTMPAGDSTTAIANTAFVQAGLDALESELLAVLGPPDLSAYARLDSPDFTGIPLAPTANPGTSTGQIATTAFVANAVTASTSGVASFNGRTGAVVLSVGDVTGAGGAPALSPNLTGTPLAPTASPATNTQQIATTAFVQAALSTIGSGVTSFNGRSGAVTLVTADVTGAGGAPIAGPVFTGTVRAPTPAPATNDTTVATTAYVTSALSAVTSGVTSFNSRTGAVTLLNADISAAGGALISSPTFTGVPAAPTAPANTATTQLATTAFVVAQIAASTGAGVTSFNTRTGAVTLVLADVTGAGGAPVSSPALTGVPTAPTAAQTSSDTTIATTAFVHAAVAAGGGVTSFNSRTGAVTLSGADVSAAGGALLAGPAFTGTPTAPTASPGTNTGQVATTAFVLSQITSGAVASFNGRNGAVTLTSADITGAGGALLASPTFSGTPNAPTQAPGTNDTTIATTAFVQAATSASGVTSVTAGAGLAGGGTGAVTLSVPVGGITSGAGGMIANINSKSLLGNNTAGSNPPGSLGVAAVMTMLGAAPLASPTFTGTPAAPTAAVGVSTTQVATTQFVAAGFLPLSGGVLTGTLTAPYIIVKGANTTTDPSIVLQDSTGTQQGYFTYSHANGSVAVGNGPGTGWMAINGDTTFQISNATAYKPSGGSWTAPSDARIKTVIGEYSSGLAEILQLRPVVYRYRGNDAPPGGRSPNSSGSQFAGLVGQEAEAVLPSIVSKSEGWIDGMRVSDMRSLDPSELVYALINAVKTLADRVRILEGAVL